MKASSAPGMFGLDVPTLRELCRNNLLADYITKLLNAWIKGDIGDHLLLTFLTAIPKPERDPSLARNLRPISVTSIWYRLV